MRPLPLGILQPRTQASRIDNSLPQDVVNVVFINYPPNTTDTSRISPFPQASEDYTSPDGNKNSRAERADPIKGMLQRSLVFLDFIDAASPAPSRGQRLNFLNFENRAENQSAKNKEDLPGNY